MKEGKKERRIERERERDEGIRTTVKERRRKKKTKNLERERGEGIRTVLNE